MSVRNEYFCISNKHRINFISPTMDSDQRLTQRKKLFRPAKIMLAGGRSIASKTTNISASGACLMASEAIPVGTNCLINFDIDLDGVFHKINIISQVCNVSFAGLEGSRIGLRFLKFDETSAEIIDKFLKIPIEGIVNSDDK